ncbi:MAG: diaminopimelate decarboxylase [Spirochaetales bacterium]|nr:diaminopimelate decarboxylase [Spirochaetales bacterium]
MTGKTVPLDREQLESICGRYGTPFHLYDEKAIRENARRFYRAFDWVPGGFKNYFAVKALPNPHILEILKEEGMGADCSSMAELLLAKAVGLPGEDIMFTSNDTPAEEFRAAREMKAIINLDDISHIPFLEKEAGLPELLCLRYNPGNLKSGNAIIGEPEDAKYGFTRSQVLEGYRTLREKGLKRFGLHTMVASNELKADYFVETARILFELAAEVFHTLGIRLEFINLGGGIGIPYRPEQQAVDMEYVSRGIRRQYEEIIEKNGLDPVQIVFESGRMVTGPYGYLVTRVRHIKKTYKTFVGVDATMANLMRPGMYGAYHHISLPGKPADTEKVVCDVAGSLCENNDKFAVARQLPEVKPGDLMVIHDTGAHGHAMGFNYNGKLRSAEVLLKEDGSTKLIRRAETVKDLFATLEYPGL